VGVSRPHIERSGTSGAVGTRIGTTHAGTTHAGTTHAGTPHAGTPHAGTTPAAPRHHPLAQ